MTITINRVYTRSGDKGETSLVDGSRTSKDSVRCEAFGTVDELNAILGIVKEAIDSKFSVNIAEVIEFIQQELFDLGAELATPIAFKYPAKLEVSDKNVSNLEAIADSLNKNLLELKSFILPGGSLLASYLHLARTVCRRAERNIVTLSKQEQINDKIIAYINRLSDLLFILSRFVLADLGKPESLWIQDKERKVPIVRTT